ncbi:MAG: NAD(P)H-hydrate dehydratase [Candidatus Diapherotrites archaeon]|uniref:ADP-dependent (S)-NAD(P)H-hydrate dehydratase n=1 Tax=Candidatus Iainarchaeum sp. TaxID=3101447 RepID=A0A8T3YL67_9ARCH|nr:NAD(P)H-hydrate dehydratase [Candidatus Diapherotrites archaeon]
MRTVTLSEVRKFFPKRKRDSHKGQNGRVLVIGGSKDLTGAPALAAMAAIACLRSGVDLVTVASLEKPAWAISAYSPDLIVKKLAGREWGQQHLKTLLKLAKKADSVLIGNGMGREKATLHMIRRFVQKCRARMVLDADALHACRGMKLRPGTIITPHMKEFEAFSGVKVDGKALSNREALAKMAAARHRCIVLLKGRIDIISDGKKVLLNRTGNARMTVGGTGDLLAGICTGFLALKAEPLEAAAAAAFVNGMAGDALLKKVGYTFIASDMAPEIARQVKRILK